MFFLPARALHWGSAREELKAQAIVFLQFAGRQALAGGYGESPFAGVDGAVFEDGKAGQANGLGFAHQLDGGGDENHRLRGKW